MNESKFNSELKFLCIKDKYELLEKYKDLLKEISELRKFKAAARKKYEKMEETIITYMDKYGSLNNKKGK